LGSASDKILTAIPATVYLCKQSATSSPCSGADLATIYTDNTHTTIRSNPFSTDSVGNFYIYADPGEYKLQVRYSNNTYSTADYHIGPSVSYANVWTGTNNFTGTFKVYGKALPACSNDGEVWTFSSGAWICDIPAGGSSFSVATAHTWTAAQTFNAGVKTSPFNTMLGYGCAHDGTDASICVQAAVTASVGSTLWLEPGFTYTHASTITVGSGTRILGTGNVDANVGVAHFRYTGTGTAWQVSTATGNGYTYAVRLSGFRISSSGSAAKCLDLDHIQESEFDHLTIGGATGTGCTVGINAHGMSLSQIHTNRISWNGTGFVVDGNAITSGYPSETPSGYNSIYSNNFFECSSGIQFKNFWQSSIHDNYFESCDDWFKLDTSAGSYFGNRIELIGVNIFDNAGIEGSDAAHVNPHFLRITGAGTMDVSTDNFTMRNNWWDTTGSSAGALVDSTTSGAIAFRITARSNRIIKSDTVWSTSRTALFLRDYENVYRGSDGLSQPTTLYSGFTPVEVRDDNIFEVAAPIGVSAGYGIAKRWVTTKGLFGCGGLSPNACSLAWGDGTGWKLNFGYFPSAVGSFTPTATLTDTGMWTPTANRALDGSVSVPTYSFANETNSGWYRSTASDVRFTLAGADLMRFRASRWTIHQNAVLSWGSVGIGTDDAGFSRTGVSAIACGNGAQGDFSCTFKATTLAAANVQLAGSSSGTATIVAPAAAGTPTLTLPTTTGTFALAATTLAGYGITNGVANTRTVNGKALSADITLGLASSDFANQGTTTTVLHGNAAGNPSFAGVAMADLSSKLGTGTKVATTSATAPASNKCAEFDTSGTLVVAGSNAACGSGGGTPAGGTNDLQYGSAGAFAAITAPTANGNYVVNYNVTAGAAVAPTATLPGIPTNAQTGTTYTFLYSDRGGYTTFSNAGSIAVTLPQSGTTGFASNFYTKACNIGAGTATITPTTSTISYTTGSAYTSGAASLALTTGQCAIIQSDNTNYFANVQAASSGTPTTRLLTAGAGLAGGGDLSADRTFSVDSTEQAFLSAGALTCGASTNGKMMVHTTPLEYCDNTATPVLRYAAYGDSAGKASTAAAADTATTAANLSGTPALPNGTTATTQAAADNSTKLATTAYVDSSNSTQVTAAANYTSGDLVQAAAANRTTSSSGIQTANVVTAASNFASGGLVKAAGANKTLASADLVGDASTSGGMTVTLAAQYKKLSCQPGLGDGLNAIPAGTYLQTTCYNDTGVTVTITGIKCFTDNSGTSTLNATNGAATALLTGAVTCSSSFAAGTQSGTTTIASGDFIKFTFVADGTSKQATWVVTSTY
jgi:hypothetical protein